MDKRVVFIAVGLLVILYLVGNKANPELVQTLRDKVTGVVTGKSGNETPASDEANPWDKRRQEVFTTRVSESKRRAIAKYPDIAVVNTEMNSRFVFRYKYMTKENDERLKSPNWPEMLADDCAAASGVRPRTAPPDGKVAASAPGSTKS